MPTSPAPSSGHQRQDPEKTVEGGLPRPRPSLQAGGQHHSREARGQMGGSTPFPGPQHRPLVGKDLRRGTPRPLPWAGPSAYPGHQQWFS